MTNTTVKGHIRKSLPAPKKEEFFRLEDYKFKSQQIDTAFPVWKVAGELEVRALGLKMADHTKAFRRLNPTNEGVVVLANDHSRIGKELRSGAKITGISFIDESGDEPKKVDVQIRNVEDMARTLEHLTKNESFTLTYVDRGRFGYPGKIHTLTVPEKK